jgi:hypothetical protein
MLSTSPGLEHPCPAALLAQLVQHVQAREARADDHGVQFARA